MSRPRKEPRLPNPPTSLSKYRRKQLERANDTILGQKLLAALSERRSA